MHWKRVAKHLGKQRTSKEYRTYWKQTLRDKVQSSTHVMHSLLTCAVDWFQMEVVSVCEESGTRKRKRSDSSIDKSSCNKIPRHDSSDTPENGSSRKSLSASDQALARAIRAGQPNRTQIAQQLQNGYNQCEPHSHWREVVHPVLKQTSTQPWTSAEVVATLHSYIITFLG